MAMPILLLGAHLSIAGGFHRAVELAGRLKCNCLQVFLKNQRQWRCRPLAAETIDAFLDARAKSARTLRHVLAHSAYLINLAGDQSAIRRRSLSALRTELRRCRALKIDRLIMHPGSHRGQGLGRGIEHVVAGLNRVLADDPGRTTILLEVTAGAGDTIGSRLEEIAEIMQSCKYPDRLGCCLDTCHLFAAGYHLSPRDRFDQLIRRIDRLIGFDRIGCIHLNDSAVPFAARRDRHEHIGRGHIGLDAFRYFLTEPSFVPVPKIIETPKGPARDLKLDRRNLRVLRKLYLHKPALSD